MVHEQGNMNNNIQPLSSSTPTSATAVANEQQKQVPNTSWATNPSLFDDNRSLYSEVQYEIPIHDPDSNDHRATTTGSSSQRRMRNNNNAAASASSQSQKSHATIGSSRGGGDRGSAPFSTAGSVTVSENDPTAVWDTTLNTPHRNNNNTENMSLQERITNTAISSTIELLKQVGGVTVSATGALVAPPLHITRTVLLPNLYAAFKDFISTNSPVRLKDWFRIFSTSIYHVFNTLQNTDSGHAFSNRIVLVFIDMIDCLSAETTRQLLLDTMSCFVKFFDIIHTPTFKTYCEQLTITGCRLIDAISNGRNKLLLHDLQKVIESVGELLADPATTIALAEVTAYLCYALEMEDQQIQIDERRQTNNTQQQNDSANNNNNNKNHNNKNKASSPRRKERDIGQRQVVLQRDTLNNGHTVEEVILSSLNVVTSTTNGNDNRPNSSSIPTNIVLDDRQQQQQSTNTFSIHNKHNNSNTLNPDSIKYDLTSPHHHHHHEHDTLEWHERVRDDVDVQVLRVGLLHRASSLQEQQQQQQQQIRPQNEQQQPTIPEQYIPIVSNGIKTTCVEATREYLQDIEDPDDRENAKESSHNDIKLKRSKQSIQVRFTNNDVSETDAMESPPSNDNDPISQLSSLKDNTRKVGESASDHFYRILDEILTEKRLETVEQMIATEQKENGSSTNKVGVSRNIQQQQSNNPSIRDRLNTIRSNNKNNKDTSTSLRSTSTTPVHVSKNTKSIIIIVGIIVLCIVCFWFVMGCFGMYMYMKPLQSKIPILQQQHNAIVGHNNRFIDDTSSQEIIIRIVKEVVHVNQDGIVIGQGPWKQRNPTYNMEMNSNDEDVNDHDDDDNINYQKVAECVASIYAPNNS